jgi:membrane associated rhomboid family serine protease
MTSTPVGMRCPECAKQRTQVRTAANIGAVGGEPIATYVLIGINVIVFLAEVLGGSGGTNSIEAGRDLTGSAGLCGNAIAGGGFCGVQHQDGGDLFRLVTGAFLHAGPLHLLFNMFALYVLGTLLEPIIGTLRFLGIYFTALLAGSLGALLATNPNEVTVGASGAIFGLMGAAFVIARHRGVEQLASQIGLFVVLNLVFTFAVPGISIGGHIGGLIGGALAALIIEQLEKRLHGSHKLALELVGLGLICVLSVAGALWAAGQSSAVIG